MTVPTPTHEAAQRIAPGDPAMHLKRTQLQKHLGAWMRDPTSADLRQALFKAMDDYELRARLMCRLPEDNPSPHPIN